MAYSIPLPRRGLRSLFLGLLFILGPYILLRHLSSISADAQSESSYFPVLGKKGGVDVHGRSNAETFIKSNDKAKRPRDGDDDNDPDFPLGVPVPKPTKPKSKSKTRPPPKIESRDSQHTYHSNGLVEVNPEGQHPIFDLIKRRGESWRKKVDKASTTLEEAVDEYRRRYHRAPPRGFDRWWKYVRKHDVQLPDEYDQIHHDLEPFHALTPPHLRELIRTSSLMSGMFIIKCPPYNPAATLKKDKRCTAEITEKGLNEEGRRVASQRAEGQLDLLDEVLGELEEVETVFYSHDVPWQFVGHEYKSALVDSAEVGEYLNVDEHDLDWAHLGWASACAPHKPLRETYDPEILPDLEGLWSGEKSFIWDHKAAMDPCIHPTMTHLVGFLSGHGKGPGPSKELYPVMAMCKTTLHSDVLAVSIEAWTEDVGDDPSWEEKSEDRMLWRGKNTGIYFKDGVPWNISQRINLVDHTTRTKGSIPVLDVSPPETPVGQARDNPLWSLNEDLMDVGFVDEAIQCDKEVCEVVERNYAYKGRKDWSEGNQYKYLLDIDGNGWSARFKRLMSTNSVVLKSTIFPEWYTDRIQPWVHYIPIKADLTDLYDVMTFFKGGHDSLAKDIAIEGTNWSKTFWRKEDMVAYQFRLFLEYARLLAPDRAKAAFHLKK